MSEPQIPDTGQSPAHVNPPEIPRKQVFGFFLGLAGMAAFLLGIQFSMRGDYGAIELTGSLKLGQIGPFVSSVGCLFFCTAYVLIWNVSLARLIGLIMVSGTLVWGVSQVSLTNIKALTHQLQNELPATATQPSTTTLPDTSPVVTPSADK